MVEPGFGGADEPPYDGDFLGEWSALYRRVNEYLLSLNKTSGPFTGSDFWVVDEHLDLCLLQVEVSDLDLIRPHVIEALRAIVNDYPVFGLTVNVQYTKTDGSRAPGMGLIIYKGEIVDELRKEHLPIEFRKMTYV